MRHQIHRRQHFVYIYTDADKKSPPVIDAIPPTCCLRVLCRKCAASRQRRQKGGWGPRDRSGIDTKIPDPADIERTETKYTPNQQQTGHRAIWWNWREPTIVARFHLGEIDPRVEMLALATGADQATRLHSQGSATRSEASVSLTTPCFAVVFREPAHSSPLHVLTRAYLTPSL